MCDINMPARWLPHSVCAPENQKPETEAVEKDSEDFKGKGKEKGKPNLKPKHVGARAASGNVRE